MVVGIIIGSIFLLSGLGFLVGRAVEAVLPEEEVPVIEVPTIEEVPIEEIEVIIPGNGEVLITQIGL